MASEPPISEDRQTVGIELAVSGRKLKLQLSLSTKPVKLTDLLPTLRSLSDALGGAALAAAEGAGERLSCRQKCAACCRHLVALEETEARRIAELVEEIDEPWRSKIKARLKAALQEVEAAGLLPRYREMEKVTKADFLSFALEYFARKIPCPFLEDESCLIYEERPFVCRQYLVVSPAENCGTMTMETANSVKSLNFHSDVPGALAKVERDLSPHPRKRIPMLLALEWAAAQPEETAMRSELDLMHAFFSELCEETGSENPPDVSTAAPDSSQL